jgi:NADH:ubiquinone oxidoreductase subunit 3 (subunit A)
MKDLLLVPPVAFLIVLSTCLVLMALFRRIAFRKKSSTQGSKESYACGEPNYDHMAQPDYSNVFPFAFFFTMAHVATLIMTTVPIASQGIFFLVIVYIMGSILGLYILFRRQ